MRFGSVGVHYFCTCGSVLGAHDVSSQTFVPEAANLRVCVPCILTSVNAIMQKHLHLLRVSVSMSWPYKEVLIHVFLSCPSCI